MKPINKIFVLVFNAFQESSQFFGNCFSFPSMQPVFVLQIDVVDFLKKVLKQQFCLFWLKTHFAKAMRGLAVNH